MMMIDILFYLVAVYLIIGFVFAVLFVTIGISRVDETAKGSPVGFRIIIIPGTAVFWPILLKKWMQAKKIRQHD